MSVGSLDDPEAFPPRGEFFCRDRASWMPEIPGEYKRDPCSVWEDKGRCWLDVEMFFISGKSKEWILLLICILIHIPCWVWDDDVWCTIRTWMRALSWFTVQMRYLLGRTLWAHEQFLVWDHYIKCPVVSLDASTTEWRMRDYLKRRYAQFDRLVISINDVALSP